MPKFLAVALFSVLFLAACNEQKKIESLKHESAVLESRVDLLKAEIKKAEDIAKNSRIILDTVRAGE